MFIFSAISKLLSMAFFDSMVAELFLGSQYYDNPGGMYFTQILSRILISAEMVLGIAVLQEKWLKKIIIPALFGMLLLFTVHLFYEGITSPKGFIEGNCGCFGDILPMNNLESILKNVVAMFLCILVWAKYEDDPLPGLWTSIITGGVTLLTLWLTIKTYEMPTIEQNLTTTESTDTNTIISETPLINDANQAPEAQDTTKQKAQPETKPADSKDLKTFSVLKLAGKMSDGTTLQPEKGEKLVCLFSMTCGHCQETFHDLCGFSGQTLPKIYLLNFGKEFEQDYFFNKAGCKSPHWRTEDFPLFKRMLEGESFPRILHIKNGKVVKSWNIDTYKKEDFMKYFNLSEKKEPGGLQLQKPGSWGGEPESEGKKPWD